MNLITEQGFEEHDQNTEYNFFELNDYFVVDSNRG